MKYKLTDNEVIKIVETSGVIQNISNREIMLSDTSDFKDVYYLREWRYTGFTKQLYIKARETIPTGHSVKINVV